MKAKISLSILALGIIVSAFGQKPSMELTFTAVDSAVHSQLVIIKVMNRTQGGDTLLYYPDTVLVLEYTVGIPEINNDVGALKVFQNYPNPVVDQTTITLYVPEKDKVSIILSDMLGRKVVTTERLLESGYHSFKFTPGNGRLVFFNAQWRGNSSTIKILKTDNASGSIGSLEYIGRKNSESQTKTIEAKHGFSFSLGDELLYIGYTDTLNSGMLDVPEASKTYTFQFATNIPCPGTPTVTYEGQVYNTIQIFSQCWLKENLNVGTMIPGAQDMEDNDTIEKYCYENEPDSCTVYGGLYQWDEMMQYTTQQGTQGICPPGWHLPTDEEWKVLEGAVDSQFWIGNPEWDDIGWRGYDAGTNLKTTSGWAGGGNGTNLFGFSGLPSGARYPSSSFDNISIRGYFWTSTKNYTAWFHGFYFDHPEVIRMDNLTNFGYSVRCLRDY